MPKVCPFCDKTLEALLYDHAHSTGHTEALKRAGIDPSDDPVLKVLKKLEGTEEDELFTPPIPEPSKDQQKLKLDSSSMSINAMDNLENIDTDETKGVFANCARCDTIITVPVPRHLILNSKLPVVAVSYIHKNKELTDQHSITIYLDHDFDIRRQRYSDVVF